MPHWGRASTIYYWCCQTNHRLYTLSGWWGVLTWCLISKIMSMKSRADQEHTVRAEVNQAHVVCVLQSTSVCASLSDLKNIWINHTRCECQIAQRLSASFCPRVMHCASVTLAPECVLTEHWAVAVCDRLSLHRQLHLDACLCFCIKDGYAHALLYACSKHRGCSDQITPERRAIWRKGGQPQIKKKKKKEGKQVEGGGEIVRKERTQRYTEEDNVEVAKQRGRGGDRRQAEVREQRDTRRTEVNIWRASMHHFEVHWYQFPFDSLVNLMSVLQEFGWTKHKVTFLPDAHTSTCTHTQQNTHTNGDIPYGFEQRDEV